MESVVVIANPVASQFTGGSHRDVMAELAKTHDVDAVWPGSAPETTMAAEKAVADGASVVVAMGGDGMVHHVAQGLVGSHTSLGIIPAGTTNVVARIFEIPSRHSRAARLIGRDPEPTVTGTVRMTLKRGETETVHHAVFACGFGLDAEVVRVADSDPYRKYRFGSIHYARSALGVGFKEFPSVETHIAFSSGELSTRGTSALVQFRDVYSYFGRIAIRFNEVRPDPMTTLILGRLRRRRIPGVFVKALTRGDLDDVDGFDVWNSISHLELVADPPVATQADGESLGMIDGGVVEWVPDSLRVIRG